jgi:dolichol-phosphate mannosyltransferase
LRVVELPVPLIYLEEARSFGGSLDDGRKRLEYYHRVLDQAMTAAGLGQFADELCDVESQPALETGCKSS